MTSRSTAFFMNGGAGRVLSSIPAFEKYHEEHPEDDFIIVCEGGTDFFKGHPILGKRAFDNWHKQLFEEKIKVRNCVTTEPYRIWEYYNQKCNLSQAFDIQINNKGVRNLPKPTLRLTAEEFVHGKSIIEDVKEKTKKEKVIIFQPYGRGAQPLGKAIIDSTGRSFEMADTIKLIKRLQKKYSVVMMSEFKGDYEKMGITEPLAQPENVPLRIWGGIIRNADVFLGCDSVGQHLAYALDVPAVVVVGSTFPENVSYTDNNKFQVLDVGVGRRVYDPIRVSLDEDANRNNESLMRLNDAVLDEIMKYVDKMANKNFK